MRTNTNDFEQFSSENDVQITTNNRNYCRVCIDKPGTVNIHDKQQIEDEETTLNDILNDIGPQPVQAHRFPKKVCAECFKNLIFMFTLYKQYRKSSGQMKVFLMEKNKGPEP